MHKNYIIIAVIAMLLSQVGLLLWLGHPLICDCERLKLWDGVIQSSENSQHILDWYSFSHFIFGFLVYFALWITRMNFNWPKHLGTAFVILVLVSSGWEIFENTHYAIGRFQENTISYEYRGDSVVNALMDTTVMSLGFFAAGYLPVWLSILIIASMETTMIIFTRDGLILHGLMFVYPIKSIFHWQASLTK
jgi:hypothetical protein